MELDKFEAELRLFAKNDSNVTGIIFTRTTLVSLKALIYLQHGYSIVVFYNQSFSIYSFSLIYQNQRMFGIDRDNRIGWHIHPFDNSDIHLPTDEKSPKEIFGIILEIYQNLKPEETDSQK